jgi:putative phosphoesterase
MEVYMKIIVFADSHSDVDTMSMVIGTENPDMIIHLGDHVADGVELQQLFPNILIELVKGNTDKTDEYLPEKTLLLDNKVAFITHGDSYDVENGFSDIIDRGISVGADTILFGHTHKPYLQNERGIWIMNPGRIGRISSKVINATYGILIIENDTITCEIVEFDSI